LGGAAAITSPITSGVNGTQYEQQFNATKIATGWSSTPFSGIPLIGDIFAGFNFLWSNIKYMVDGFPTLLTWIEHSFITDPSGIVAFEVLANALRAIFAFLIVIFLIEYIGGRNISD
jgi:hypothetical protein